MGFLYQLTSPSGKRYVGVTVRSVEKRWRQHMKDSQRGNLAIHAAIRKYSPEAFEVKTLAQVEDSEMFELEKRAIAALGTKAPLGYNLTDGGEGGLPGFTHSEETRRRLSEAKLGRSLTDEHKEKLRAAKLGTRRGPHSEETKAKIGAASAGRLHSAESKRKMSAAACARWKRERNG
jgi:group I intron endonuclease